MVAFCQPMVVVLITATMTIRDENIEDKIIEN